MVFFEMSEEDLFDNELDYMVESASIAVDRIIDQCAIACATDSFDYRKAVIDSFMEGSDGSNVKPSFVSKTRKALKRAWDAVVTFIDKIKQKMRAKSVKNVPNAEVEVDAKTWKGLGKIKELGKRAKSCFSNGKLNPKKIEAFKKFLIIAAAAVGLVFVGRTLKKKHDNPKRVTVNAKEVQQQTQQIENVVNDLQNLAKDIGEDYAKERENAENKINREYAKGVSKAGLEFVKDVKSSTILCEKVNNSLLQSIYLRFVSKNEREMKVARELMNTQYIKLGVGDIGSKEAYSDQPSVQYNKFLNKYDAREKELSKKRDADIQKLNDMYNR